MDKFETSMSHSRKLFPLSLNKVLTPECLLFAIVSIYFILFSYWTVNHSIGWISTGWDDGAYNQLMFNSLHGRWFEGSLEMNAPGVTRLGQHFTPSMALLLPLYAIHPKTETLLVIQTFLMSLSAVLVYFLALKLTHRKWISLVLSGSFLLHPGIQAINRVSFHEVCLAPPLLLTTLLLYENKRRLFSLIPLILLCFVKEDMPLIAVGLGLFLLVSRRSLRWGGTYLSVGVLLFISIHFLLMPKFQAWQELYDSGHSYAYVYSGRYTELMGKDAAGTMGDLVLSILLNPIRVIKILFSWDKIVFCAALLFPVGLLPLLAPASLLIALPNLLTLILSNEEWMYSFNAYYAGAFTPAFYYGACLAIHTMDAKTSWFSNAGFLSKLLSVRISIFQILFGTTLVFILACWPLLQPIATLPNPSPQTEYVRNLLEFIPSNASVGSTPRYASYLSSRRGVWAFDPMTSISGSSLSEFESSFEPYDRSMKPTLKRADWIFLDSSEAINLETGSELYYKDFLNAVKSRDWCIHFSDENYLIARKANGRQQCSQDALKEVNIVSSLLGQEGGLDTYKFAPKNLLESDLSSICEWNQVAGEFSLSEVPGPGVESLRIEKISGENDARLETSFIKAAASPSAEENTTKEVYGISLLARSLSNAGSSFRIGCSDGASQSSQQSFELTEDYLEKDFFCSIIGSRSESIYLYILVPEEIDFDIKDIKVSRVENAVLEPPSASQP